MKTLLDHLNRPFTAQRKRSATTRYNYYATKPVEDGDWIVAVVKRNGQWQAKVHDVTYRNSRLGDLRVQLEDLGFSFVAARVKGVD